MQPFEPEGRAGTAADKTLDARLVPGLVKSVAGDAFTASVLQDMLGEDGQV